MLLQVTILEYFNGQNGEGSIYKLTDIAASNATTMIPLLYRGISPRSISGGGANMVFYQNWRGTTTTDALTEKSVNKVIGVGTNVDITDIIFSTVWMGN